MTTLKSARIPFLLVAMIVSLSSCREFIASYGTEPCGKDISLGNLTFQDSTKKMFANWTGKETLIFKDTLGNEKVFLSSGKYVGNKKLVRRILCNNNSIDKQEEYYTAEYQSFSYRIDDPKQSTFFEFALEFKLSSPDSVLFNQFSVRSNSLTLNIGSLYDKPIVQEARENYSYKNYNFVADTTINGKNFKSVYFKTDDYTQSGLYFQKSNMIIAIRIEGKTWLLDRIK